MGHLDSDGDLDPRAREGAAHSAARSKSSPKNERSRTCPGPIADRESPVQTLCGAVYSISSYINCLRSAQEKRAITMHAPDSVTANRAVGDAGAAQAPLRVVIRRANVTVYVGLARGRDTMKSMLMSGPPRLRFRPRLRPLHLPYSTISFRRNAMSALCRFSGLITSGVNGAATDRERPINSV